MFNKGYGITFSPCGTTMQVMKQIYSSIDIDWQTQNIVEKSSLESININSKDICVFAAPVYAGRLPKIYVDKIKNIKGNKALAIPVVTYGNREYGDALIELVDILNENEFRIVGAGSFIAQHSIFPNTGLNRPNEKDLGIVDKFTKECLNIYKNADLNNIDKLDVNGNRPYKKAIGVPIKPKAKSSCNKCGKCVTACPTDSILKSKLHDTNKKTCISCGACIKTCPTNSRAYSGLAYTCIEKVFTATNSKYKDPELFYVNKPTK